MNKGKRYEVFCEDFSYLVYADSVMEAYGKFKDLWQDENPFAIVEHSYLEGRYLKIGEVRDEGLEGLF
jgi:hypothetical protein